MNEDFEPTGLVGLGDARAVHELTTYLSSIGVSADMAYTSDKAAGQVKNNIVLLGAEEANHLVKGPFHDIPSTLRFETSSPMTLYDTLSGEPYRAEWEGKEIITDYGKLVRARNPYAPEYALVMICGIYGYGTWGGVRLLGDQQFLKRCAELGETSGTGDVFELECIYKVPVHQGEPFAAIPLDIRPLAAPTAV